MQKTHRHHVMAFCGSLLCFCLVASCAWGQNSRIVITTDRPDAMYSRGDTVTFTINATQDDKPAIGQEFICTITQDGGPVLDQQTFTVTDQPQTFQAKADKPGFIRCTVPWPDQKDDRGRAVVGVGGAAVDPLLIEPSSQEPDDFDAFWKSKTDQLDALPLQVQMTAVQNDQVPQGVVAFDVTINNLTDPPARAYFAMPAHAEPQTCPAILLPHGAGVRSSTLSNACQYAAQGFLAMDINAHGILNGQPAEFYSDLAKGELADYRSRGGTDRDTFYFLGMFQRLYRGLQFLKSRPEWDQQILIVNGSSQGGAQALAGGALDQQVTLVLAGVPAMCDHAGRLVDRQSGWPGLIDYMKLRIDRGDATPEDLELLKKTSGYYDGVFFARRIHCRTAVAVAFLDTTCPPAGVYAAYNNLGTDNKRMVNNLLFGHAVTELTTTSFAEEIEKHLAQHQAVTVP